MGTCRLALWASDVLEESFGFYAVRYCALAIGFLIVTVLRSTSFAWASINAATKMHNDCLLRLLRCPMEFFETT